VLAVRLPRMFLSGIALLGDACSPNVARPSSAPLRLGISLLHKLLNKANIGPGHIYNQHRLRPHVRNPSLISESTLNQVIRLSHIVLT
jgi:hypothetical protein